MHKRPIFFISDRTGITAETLGSSLITQFEGIPFHTITLPFMDSLEKAKEGVTRIHAAGLLAGVRPIVFSTIIDPEIRTLFENSSAFFIDFFQTFIGPLEKELQTPSSHTAGRSHGAQSLSYNARIEAVNFALRHDDGGNPKGYANADIILAGVSRSGKTPCCLYLAMHYGIRVANYPLTEDDLQQNGLPKCLKDYRQKVVGLTISAKRLHTIREQRKPNSPYASLDQCQYELKQVETLFLENGIKVLNSTDSSIEELAAKIMIIAKIERNPL